MDGVRRIAEFGLREAMPAAEMVNAALVAEGCRAIKDGREIAFLDFANCITKLEYREALAGLHLEMTTDDLVAAIAQAHSTSGVRGGGWPLFGCGPQQFYISGSLRIRQTPPFEPFAAGTQGGEFE